MEREQLRWQIATELTDRFIARPDVFAIQLPDGRYISVRKRCTPGVMYLHLEGQLTLGAYLLDAQSQTRQLVLDADDSDQFDRLIGLAKNLEVQRIPSYLETSRRGGHLRLFFETAVSGRMARGLGRKLIADNHLRVELYPKQEMVGDGPGSLVRVPFGVHRITGKRYGFIRPDGSPLASLMDQVRLLSHPDPVPTGFIMANQYCEAPKTNQLLPRPGNGETVWERLKTSTTVFEFISQYVDLKPTGNGYLGKCPFHTDTHPSFGINVEGNYWHCFAGCGGGSIIDFWMLYHQVDFKTAVTELEAMLLVDKSKK